MRAGELRHRVTIQRPLQGKDEEGYPVVTWKDVTTVWAAVEPLRGREYFSAATTNSEITTRFRLRYKSDIQSDMRLVYQGTPYSIESVIDVDGLRRELEVMGVGGDRNGGDE